MKTPTNTKPTFTKRKIPLLAIIAVGIIVTLTWSGITLFSKPTVNYAEEVAKPLEEGLVKAGGVKKCSYGDSGHGSDNDKPNYEGRYQLDMGKEEATMLINRVAKDNGFALSHSDSPYESIEWYTDKATRDSGYQDLVDGKIILSISTYSDTSKHVLTCSDGTSLVGDEAHTALTLSVGLPSMKR